MRRRARTAVAVGISAAVIAGAGLLAVTLSGPTRSQAAPASPVATRPVSPHTGPHAPVSRASAVPAPPVLSPETIAALAPADYRAVIPGLVPAPSAATWSSVYQLQADAPLFGDDRTTPVARFESTDFLGEPSVVVRVAVDGPWSLVLVPSRRLLPSQATAAGESAPAQSAAWLPTTALSPGAVMRNRVVISVSAQTLTITDATGHPEQTFPVGVGAPGTPTPTEVTGYLEARYLDPAQGQSVHRIQLSSLHATAADEPYGGSDGGLIGIHYESESSGTVSHGCVRLDGQAITAVDTLALGTPIIMAG